jgi:hypothetical protein
MGTCYQNDTDASLVPQYATCQVSAARVFPVDWIKKTVYLHEQQRMDQIRWVTNSWN